MDRAYDMDVFFRKHALRYVAEHPEKHAAKEEIYENRVAGRIFTLDKKLAVRRTICFRRSRNSRTPPAMKNI